MPAVQQITRPVAETCRQIPLESPKNREPPVRAVSDAPRKTSLHLRLAREGSCSLLMEIFSSEYARTMVPRSNLIGLNPGFVPGNVLLG